MLSSGDVPWGMVFSWLWKNSLRRRRQKNSSGSPHRSTCFRGLSRLKFRPLDRKDCSAGVSMYVERLIIFEGW